MRLVTDVLSVGFRSERTPRYSRGSEEETRMKAWKTAEYASPSPNCATESRKGEVTKVLRPKQKIGSEENQGRDIAISCEVRLGHVVMFRSLILP